MQERFNDLRNKYDTFIFEKYDIEESEKTYKITYYFNVVNLVTFKPTIEIPKLKKLDVYANYLIFNIGMIELISYWKATCSKNVIIKAGYLNDTQLRFFKKQYFNGLGELFYTNAITTNINDFMNIICDHEKESLETLLYHGIGNLIPIGGGKDSCVSMELLKDEFSNNSCFIINPKEISLSCCNAANYKDNKIITINRSIDTNLIELNKQGFINGHTPFSAIVAFTSFLIAYLNNNKYIILSNEESANQPTVLGTEINHQYSKTFEFEKDFNEYTANYFKIDIKYFSLLRCLNESQIALLFSNYKKYHQIFKSCNIGSKQTPWIWCNNCAKCLFVFIILSPFLYKDSLIEIFKEDLFNKEELLTIFLELLGKKKTKPFECVGTIEEVTYSISLTISNLEKNNTPLPYLLKYYKDHYPIFLNDNIYKRFNSNNNLNNYFEDLVKKELNKYV